VRGRGNSAVSEAARAICYADTYDADIKYAIFY